jgi:hypothetical protein
MAFGQDFLQGFFGTDGLRDSQTASKTFRTNGYELSPRYKFLFHVSFTVNTTEIPALKSIFGESGINQIGLLVKTVQLPSYEIEHEELNQYNRKRLVQTQIKYNPVQISFQDDQGDLSRNLWYNYFAYYYKDPTQAYGSTDNLNGSIGALANMPGFSYNTRDIYSDSRVINDWGYIGESYTDSTTVGKPAFFKDIRIYGLNQHKFAEYVLINPIITSWQHDTYDYSQGDGIMQNNMTIKYETVKYRSGAVSGVKSDTNIKGFADPSNYDNVRSPISRPGSTASVLGQGGLLDTGIGIVEDLQSGTLAGVIGAVQKAGASYNTFKGKNLRSIVNEEAIGASKQILQQTLPGAIRGAANVQLFPTPPRNANSTGSFGFGGVNVSTTGLNIGGFNIPFGGG